MALRKVLVLGVPVIHSTISVAGMTAEPDPVTGLRWLRLVREPGAGYMVGGSGPVGLPLQSFDVVEVELLRPLPEPPYAENWLVRSDQNLPVVRRLSGRQRAGFLREHIDPAPQQVLQYQERSLCLLQPDWIHGTFRLEPNSGRFAAHLAFGLGRRAYRGSYARGGLPVFDRRWQNFGRTWLPQESGWIDFDAGDLEARFGILDVYLTIGLYPKDRGHHIAILAVHTVPELGPAEA